MPPRDLVGELHQAGLPTDSLAPPTNQLQLPLDDGSGGIYQSDPKGLVGQQQQQQMAMVRCNIMGKPPPPLPLMARTAAADAAIRATNVSQHQMQRYSHQW